MRRHIFVLILLVAVAMGLRFYRLGTHSYRGTEVGTIVVASKPIPQLITTDIRCPFFRLILHWWMKLLPNREFTIRALSAILGALSIIPLYFLASRLIDKKVALISVYLASFSPLHILLSRTAEEFTLTILLVGLSLFLFIYWCEEGKGFFWYIIVTILMLYSGPLLFPILVGEWIYFWLRWQTTKHKLKKWSIAQLIILASYSYWIVIFFQELPGEWQAFDRLPVTSGIVVKAIYIFYTFSLGETVLPWNWKIVLPACYIFAGTAAFGLTRIKRKYRSLSFILVFLLLPLAPIFTNRGAPEYCIAGSIAYYILLGIGIAGMKLLAFLPILGSISFFNVYSLVNLYRDKEYHIQSFTDNWRLIAKYVQRECADSEAVVVAYHGSFIWYYTQVGTTPSKEHCDKLMMGAGENLIALDIKNPNRTKAKLTSVDKILFVHTPGSGIFSSDDKGIYEFKEWLDKNFLCTHTSGFFENEDYETKRKLLKRNFPHFRVEVFTYERRRILE